MQLLKKIAKLKDKPSRAKAIHWKVRMEYTMLIVRKLEILKNVRLIFPLLLGILFILAQTQAVRSEPAETTHEDTQAEEAAAAIADTAAPETTATTQEEKASHPIDVDAFPFFPITLQTYKGTPNTQSAISTQPANSVSPSAPDDAKWTVDAYFSPSCHHCADFFKNDLKNTIMDRYIVPNKIKLRFRPFCQHPIDFVVCQLALSRGEGQFVYLFKSFLETQEIWSQFLMPENNTPEKKEKVLSDMMMQFHKELPEGINQGLPETLMISASNTLSSIILMARIIGLSAKEIADAIEGANAETVYSRLIVTSLQAKNAEGKTVDGIPAFYINDAYKGTLNSGELETLAAGSMPIDKQKLAATTPINSSAASKSMIAH